MNKRLTLLNSLHTNAPAIALTFALAAHFFAGILEHHRLRRRTVPLARSTGSASDGRNILLVGSLCRHAGQLRYGQGGSGVILEREDRRLRNLAVLFKLIVGCVVAVVTPCKECCSVGCRTATSSEAGCWWGSNPTSNTLADHLPLLLHPSRCHHLLKLRFPRLRCQPDALALTAAGWRRAPIALCYYC